MTQSSTVRGLRSAAICIGALALQGCGPQDRSTDAPEIPAAEAIAKVPVTTDSDEALALYEQGLALLDNLHIVEANDRFQQAVAADPGFAMGYFMLANTSQMAAGFFDAVGRANDNAATASDGEQLYVRALVAFSQNDQDEQLAALSELVGMFPHDERVHMQLGSYYNGQQDFVSAIRHFQKSIAINSRFAPAYNALGYAYRSADDLGAAKSAFAKYIELIPDEANPYDSYAELLMELGSYDESIENYRKALAIDSKFSASYAGISVNHSLKGEDQRAQEVAKEMLAASRNFAERQNALFRSVTSYLFAGNLDAAMQVSEQMASEAEAIGNHAAMGGVHEYMGDILLDSGDAEKAMEHYDSALDHRQQADSNDANQAQAARAHLFKSAIAAMVAGDFDTAASKVKEYRLAAEAEGTAFEKRRIHELHAFLAMGNEDYESAAAHFDLASQLEPLVLFWSAVVNKELGNTDKATELAKRAAYRNTLSPNLPLVHSEALQLLEEMQAV